MAKITTKKIVSLSLCILTLLLISCSLTGNPHPNLPPPDAKPSLARINNRPENPETKPFKGPLEIGVHDAVLMALENNRSLKVEKRKAEISSTLEEMERAAFDFVLSSKVSFSHKREKERFPDNTTDTLTGEVELSKLFPTGTRLSSELTWG
ncbi:MAG: TolC family protein, partial [Planctomycetota bacterium]|nr:TolC family protein [Planctomycetota bacterium]